MDLNNITDKDRVAMAQAYRVYELLSPDEQVNIPEEFVETLIKFGDFENTDPINSIDEALEEGKLTTEAMYLVMYMCTF